MCDCVFPMGVPESVNANYYRRKAAKKARDREELLPWRTLLAKYFEIIEPNPESWSALRETIEEVKRAMYKAIMDIKEDDDEQTSVPHRDDQHG